MKKGLLAVQAACIFFLGLVQAATYCVSDTGSGNKDGSDWANALEGLPADLERGSIYYIADGNYGRHQFDDAEVGVMSITILKATSDDHGPDKGWQSSYGDGQAVFSGSTNVLNFLTGYYVWDGKLGQGTDASSYGFLIKTPEGSCTLDQRMVGMPGIGYAAYKVSHMRFSHTAVVSCGKEFDPARQHPFYSAPDGTHAAENITISDNLFSGGSANMLIRQWKRSVIERNHFSDQWSSSTNHGEQISPGDSCDDLIIRDNFFQNSSVYVLGIHKSGNERWKVYNNIVLGGHLSAVFANVDSSTPNVILDSEFHHNTIVNAGKLGNGILFVGTINMTGMGSKAYNNLIFGTENPTFSTGPGGSHDYNSFYRCTGNIPSEPNRQLSQEDPFVSITGSDLKLRAATTEGIDLGDEYALDRAGTDRSQDGIWHRGAYDFTGCQNDCIQGLRECHSNGFRTCGNYDSDSCLEWSSVVSCTPGQSCTSGICSARVCTPSWNCSPWSSCIDKMQTRICDDLNSCGNQSGKPAEILPCDTGIFSAGDRVKVIADPSLRVRSSAGLTGAVLGNQLLGINGTVISGPVSLDNYIWWQIDYDTAPDGWSIERSGATVYLQKTGPCSHAADDDCDGHISHDELLRYIGNWRIGLAKMAELIGAISLWKTGST
jgi:hypothetical protein